MDNEEYSEEYYYADDDSTASTDGEDNSSYDDSMEMSLSLDYEGEDKRSKGMWINRKWVDLEDKHTVSS